MAEESLEHYIGLIEKMQDPERLTAGLELSSKETKTVELAVDETRDKGFAAVEGFLSLDELESLREELAPIFALTGNRTVDGGKRGWPGVQTVHYPNLLAKTRAIDELAIDPVVLSIVEGLLGPDFQMSVVTAFSPGPGSDKQGLHQDDSFYLVPRPHAPLVMNFVFALDDFTLENGATMLVPGSHKWSKPIERDYQTERATVKAGDMLIWDGAVWHGGGANTTKDQSRRSFSFNYNVSWLRQQENQYIAIPRKVIMQMPERLQRVLGYHKLNILVGGVEYQDPLSYFKAHPD
ncbi:phytanoyl-CoA dioxygenase family protein [Gammaproteobacteria bacterium]|nr:phytanoyl-CoA dioxygenase family protein [Gammaproteobacteria bacterium]